MKKSTFILLAVLLSLIAIRVETQTLVNYGESNTSLSTSLTTAVSGSSFSIPSTYAYIVTWTVLSDGSAESSILEGSMDNSAWNTVDTQTGATGGSKNFGFTGYRFLRVSQVSRTGGTTTTGTFSVARGFINSSSGANLSSLALTGPLSLPVGTAVAPSIILGASGGLYKNLPDSLTYASASATKTFTLDANNASLRVSNFVNFGWSSTADSTVTEDTKLLRVSAGITSIGNASNINGMIQYLPTLFAALGTPANGTVCYCSDCTIANPCAGSGTGALAKRLNGVWVCN